MEAGTGGQQRPVQIRSIFLFQPGYPLPCGVFEQDMRKFMADDERDLIGAIEHRYHSGGDGDIVPVAEGIHLS